VACDGEELAGVEPGQQVRVQAHVCARQDVQIEPEFGAGMAQVGHCAAHALGRQAGPSASHVRRGDDGRDALSCVEFAHVE